MQVLDDQLLTPNRSRAHKVSRRFHIWFKLFRLFIKQEAALNRTLSFIMLIFEHLQLTCMAFLSMDTIVSHTTILYTFFKGISQVGILYLYVPTNEIVLLTLSVGILTATLLSTLAWIMYEKIKPGAQFLEKFIGEKLEVYKERIFSGLKLGLIVFAIAAVLCFLVGWIPFILKKKREIILVREFIALLPLSIIWKVKAFREFFGRALFMATK